MALSSSSSGSDPKKQLVVVGASGGGAPTPASSAPPPPTMKLLVDTKAGRVVYAEGSKDVADFIVSIPHLPPATVAGLLGNHALPGSLGAIHGSAVDNNLAFTGGSEGELLHQLLPQLQLPRGAGLQLYRCYMAGYGGSKSSNAVSESRGAPCENWPSCGGYMTMPVKVRVREEAAAGEAAATYALKDDLSMAPMVSAIPCATRLVNTLGVTTIQEKVVHLGENEALEILRAAQRSKTALTDVFLDAADGAAAGAGKKKKRKRDRRALKA